jgi:hypothetical protein
MSHATPEPDRDESVAEITGETLGHLAPWGVSILLHAGALLLSVFLVFAVVETGDEENKIIVPGLVYGPTPGGALSQRADEWRPSEVATSHTSLGRQTRPVSVSPASISLGKGPGSGSGRGGDGVGSGPRQGSGAHGVGFGLDGLGGGAPGSGGKGSPFESGVGYTGGGFPSEFFGTNGNAEKIVFLIDASGSLIDTMEFVTIELRRSVYRLSPKQSYTVIYYQGSRLLEPPPAGLKRATSENQRRTAQWIDPSQGNVIPSGRSSPVAALKQALAYKPDLVYLLSDDITGSGKDEVDQARLLAAMDKANVSQTKINTIQFIYPDPLTRFGLKGTMQLIAERTGGQYTFMTARMLGM